MSNNIVSDAMWWLRSRDKGALVFAGVIAALLLVLAIFWFTRAGNGNETGSDFLVTDLTPTAVPVFTPTPISVATTAPTPLLPTPVPTTTPTPALTTDDLVAGADNAESVTTATAVAESTAAAEVVATTTPIPAQADPAPTTPPVPAATATPTPTPTVVGTPTPEPTPCIIGGGGFCLAPGAAPPATQATTTPTPNAEQAAATAEALAPAATTAPTTTGSAPTSTTGAVPTPTVVQQVAVGAQGDIVQVCQSDGSLLIFFSLSNPATNTASVTGQPVVAGGSPLGPLTAPPGQSANAQTTLPAGYLPGGQVSISVNQVPLPGATQTVNNCAAAS